MKIDRQAKVDRARELYLSGYNCAQSVASAYAPEMGLDEKTVLRLASGFGGGMGGMRGVCGAMSGMLMVYSMLEGYHETDDMPGKRALYAAEQRMAARFTDAYGDLHCRALLKRAGVEAGSMPSERTPEYYQKRPCVHYIEACAGILAEELEMSGKSCC